MRQTAALPFREAKVANIGKTLVRLGGLDEMKREEAWAILTEHMKSDSLIKHSLAVEAAMRWYAARFEGDVEQWGATGLLHDFDYERWPEPPAHTREGATILRQRGVDEEIVGAILSHAEWNQDTYPLDRPLRKTLFAVDELSGLITACAYVRPDRLAGLTAKSVQKKLKQKSFAAGVNRDDVIRGAELIGLPIEEHIRNTIEAMDEVRAQLGLQGSS